MYNLEQLLIIHTYNVSKLYPWRESKGSDPKPPKI